MVVCGLAGDLVNVIFMGDTPPPGTLPGPVLLGPGRAAVLGRALDVTVGVVTCVLVMMAPSVELLRRRFLF